MPINNLKTTIQFAILKQGFFIYPSNNVPRSVLAQILLLKLEGVSLRRKGIVYIMNRSNHFFGIVSLYIFSTLVSASRASEEWVVFYADFNSSKINTQPFDQKNAGEDPHGGLVNLNAGTRVGQWNTSALLNSSIYTNSAGDPMLFLGTESYDLQADFAKEASLSSRIKISFDTAICRASKQQQRRNYVLGENSSGAVIFRIFSSGYKEDRGGSTLYLETSDEKIYLASKIQRVIKTNIRKNSTELSHISVILNEGNIAVWLDDVELVCGIPFYTKGIKSIDRLRFIGDSSFYDNIVVETHTKPSSNKKNKQETNNLILGVHPWQSHRKTVIELSWKANSLNDLFM